MTRYAEPSKGILATTAPHPDNARICPDCGGCTTVTNSRAADEYGWTTTRRRRDCDDCGAHFWTIEIQDDAYRRFRRASKQARETLRKALDDMEDTP